MLVWQLGCVTPQNLVLLFGFGHGLSLVLDFDHVILCKTYNSLPLSCTMAKSKLRTRAVRQELPI